MAQKIYVIIGTTRPHWLGKRIASWITKVAAKRTNFEYQIVDLEDYNLPFIPRRFRKYQDGVSSWHKNFNDADGFIFVTSEHKGDVSEELIKAISYLRNQWSNKPVGFVFYGYRKGKRAVRKLTNNVEQLKMLPAAKSVQLDEPWNLMDRNGNVKDKVSDKNLKDMLKELHGLVRAQQK